MQRLSTKLSKFPVSLPVDLHRAFKSRCAAKGVLMSDVVRKLVERELAAETGKAKPASRREEVAA